MIAIELFCLFAAGLFQDVLNTLYVRSITDRALWRATILSGVTTILGFIVFARIMAHMGPQLDALGSSLVAYAVGNSCGTWIGMRRPMVKA